MNLYKNFYSFIVIFINLIFFIISWFRDIIREEIIILETRKYIVFKNINIKIYYDYIYHFRIYFFSVSLFRTSFHGSVSASIEINVIQPPKKNLRAPKYHVKFVVDVSNLNSWILIFKFLNC